MLTAAKINTRAKEKYGTSTIVFNIYLFSRDGFPVRESRASESFSVAGSILQRRPTASLYQQVVDAHTTGRWLALV